MAVHQREREPARWGDKTRDRYACGDILGGQSFRSAWYREMELGLRDGRRIQTDGWVADAEAA